MAGINHRNNLILLFKQLLEARSRLPSEVETIQTRSSSDSGVGNGTSSIPTSITGFKSLFLKIFWIETVSLLEDFRSVIELIVILLWNHIKQATPKTILQFFIVLGKFLKMIELTYIDIVISAEAESWNGIDPTRRGRRIIRKSKSGHVLFLQSSLKISTNKMSPISCLNYKNCTSLWELK